MKLIKEKNWRNIDEFDIIGISTGYIKYFICNCSRDRNIIIEASIISRLSPNYIMRKKDNRVKYFPSVYKAIEHVNNKYRAISVYKFNTEGELYTWLATND